MAESGDGLDDTGFGSVPDCDSRFFWLVVVLDGQTEGFFKKS